MHEVFLEVEICPAVHIAKYFGDKHCVFMNVLLDDLAEADDVVAELSILV